MAEQEANVEMTVQERKRLAIQLAAQLPPDTKDALAVLDYARELLLKFLQENAVRMAASLLPVYGLVKVVRETARILVV